MIILTRSENESVKKGIIKKILQYFSFYTFFLD